MKSIPRNFIIIATLLFTTRFTAVAQQTHKMNVVSYYAGTAAGLDSFDVTKMTHLIFCFGHLSGNKFQIDNAEDEAKIRKMTSLKNKNPELKVLLSLGGWFGCESCSDAFSTEAGRLEFAQSVKKVNDQFKTDGIDLDWEYPTIRLDNDIDQNPVHNTRPEDKKNFTELVKQLRIELGSNHTLTFAAGAFQTYLDGAIEWEEVMKQVDYVNLMSYDLINGYSTRTGHHTALYSTPEQHESTDNAVKYLIKKGINPSQIIIGAAFYARVWEDVKKANNGLYQFGKFKESIAYRQFPALLSEGEGYTYHWDDVAKAPYMYNASEKTFATFDDKRSIEVKSHYVLDNKLGGIMYWELAQDAYTDGLVDEINQVKKSVK